MPRFEYTPNITLGAILQIVTILGASLTAYVALASKDIQHDERIANNYAEISRVERKVDIYRDERVKQLDHLDDSLQKLDEKVTRFIIRDLEEKVDKQNAKSRTR